MYKHNVCIYPSPSSSSSSSSDERRFPATRGRYDPSRLTHGGQCHECYSCNVHWWCTQCACTLCSYSSSVSAYSVYCLQEITTASDSINRALADRKMEIVKLCGVHHLLKKVSTSNLEGERERERRIGRENVHIPVRVYLFF